MPAFFWRHEFCPDRLKEGDLSLMEFAACAGFSAQSHFSYYFNHLAGVTPGQFRMRAKIAKKGQVPPRNANASALTIPHEQSESGGRTEAMTSSRCRFASIFVVTLSGKALNVEVFMKTKLCHILGIEFPIIAAPMGPDLTGPDLVAAVSNAGGLGILQAQLCPPPLFRQEIRRIADVPEPIR